MKYKTLFRVLLKAIGIWMFVAGLANAIGGLGWALAYSTTIGGASFFGYVGYAVAGVVEMLVGAYLFFGGRWIADLAIPSNRPYCHECGYDLSAAGQSSRCPECGTELSS